MSAASAICRIVVASNPRLLDNVRAARSMRAILSRLLRSRRARGGWFARAGWLAGRSGIRWALSERARNRTRSRLRRFAGGGQEPLLPRLALHVRGSGTSGAVLIDVPV